MCKASGCIETMLLTNLYLVVQKLTRMADGQDFKRPTEGGLIITIIWWVLLAILLLSLGWWLDICNPGFFYNLQFVRGVSTGILLVSLVKSWWLTLLNLTMIINSWTRLFPWASLSLTWSRLLAQIIQLGLNQWQASSHLILRVILTMLS